MPDRVLVVGATRILRPAVRRLAALGTEVVAVARSRTDLDALAAEAAHVTPWAVDVHDADAVLAEGTRLVLHRALLYLPGASPSTAAALRSVVRGRVVELLPSAVAGDRPLEPFTVDLLPPAPPPWTRLVLGWTATGRWHTPEEISGAALDALESGTDGVLGVVRPWQDRPV